MVATLWMLKHGKGDHLSAGLNVTFTTQNYLSHTSSLTIRSRTGRESFHHCYYIQHIISSTFTTTHFSRYNIWVCCGNRPNVINKRMVLLPLLICKSRLYAKNGFEISYQSRLYAKKMFSWVYFKFDRSQITCFFREHVNVSHSSTLTHLVNKSGLQ